MTDAAVVLVDTNVILDVFEDDPRWADWSQDQMSQWVGRIAVNPLVFAELCYEAGTLEEVEEMLATFGLDFQELPRGAVGDGSGARPRRQSARGTSPCGRRAGGWPNRDWRGGCRGRGRGRSS